MASRKLTDLHPLLQITAAKFLDDCASRDIDILITCTWRSNQEQADLYAQGRTTPGEVVTHAKPGQSAHNHMKALRPAALAFDVVPLTAGKPIWDADNPIWRKLGDIGKALGLDWAGDWVSFKEYPHFQIDDPDIHGKAA